MKEHAPLSVRTGRLRRYDEHGSHYLALGRPYSCKRDWNVVDR